MDRASADVGLMFVAYNLRRLINILNKDVFKKYLKILAILFLKIFGNLRLKIIKYNTLNFYLVNILLNFETSLYRLKFERYFANNTGF